MKPSSQVLALYRQTRRQQVLKSRIGGIAGIGENVNQVWSKKRFAKFIRRNFPSKSDTNIAALTGIPHTTVRKHVTGETTPKADHVLAYLELFGPELLCAVMGKAPGWAERSVQHERQRKSKLQKGEIEQQIAEYPAGGQ